MTTLVVDDKDLVVRIGGIALDACNNAPEELDMIASRNDDGDRGIPVDRVFDVVKARVFPEFNAAGLTSSCESVLDSAATRFTSQRLVVARQRGRPRHHAP